MLALLLLLLAAPPSDRQVGARHQFLHARITCYGEAPAVASGFVMVLRPVRVVLPDGTERTFHFIHAGVDSSGTPRAMVEASDGLYPAIGATCDFETVSHHIANDQVGDGGPDGPVGELIQKLRC